jgi:superfamily I DNA and/or RNA helicase
VKRSSEPDEPLNGVDYLDDNGACADEAYNLVAGTPWLFANSKLQECPVDVLVVDEAGQLSLVDVLAAGGSATNLLLLGDPQQLPQVCLALHPNGSGASVLEHVLGDRETLPNEDGVFLPTTWRMHPDVCEFVSEQFYDGRLGTHPICEEQVTELGTGLRWIRADHTGCSTRSEEEVGLVVSEIEQLLGRSWTDQHGKKLMLGTSDVLIVTPYNDQKRSLRDGLARAGYGDIRVGTVDKFQGQEASVVFFSAATSSSDDAPRGLGFVFSRNRFNVAISRARCLAYLVCTDAVLGATARTIDEMRTLNAACGFVEQAVEREISTGCFTTTPR